MNGKPSRYYTEPPYRARKTITFTGATGLGEVGAVPLFTVTGEVIVAFLVPYCATNLDSAGGTLGLGVTGSTVLFIGATTATAIDVGEFWTENTGAGAKGIAIPAELKDIAIEENIIGTVAAANITAGVLELTCYWWPLSNDGKVVAA